MRTRTPHRLPDHHLAKPIMRSKPLHARCDRWKHGCQGLEATNSAFRSIPCLPMPRVKSDKNYFSSIAGSSVLATCGQGSFCRFEYTALSFSSRTSLITFLSRKFETWFEPIES